MTNNYLKCIIMILGVDEMKITKKNSFKGKSFNYSTSVTATKLENILAWILGLSVIVGAFLIFFFVDSILVIIISIFGLIMLFFLFGFIVIFSKKHKEERIKNTQIYKD
ncbi:MAG: hypothetical protein J6K21_00695 [Bacilli bacterium]|nr:hypothetical protein [Bacilli bacterium]